jgi:prepilin-type N-terminal cleavage/methylation domain-containing protein
MHKSGFTLTELSISFVIISLIVAGIISSNSLLKQSRIRTLISEINYMKSNIDNFSLKYEYLPGDITNATIIWPNASTASGNGDSEINNNESFYIMQHLNLANIIQGSYSAGYSGGGYSYIYGVNTFKSTYIPAVYMMDYSSFFGGRSHNNLTIGSMNSSCSGRESTSGGFISAIEAYNIDTKIDDGIPSSGKFLSVRDCSSKSDNTKCISTDQYNSVGANYLFTDLSSSCRIQIMLY